MKILIFGTLGFLVLVCLMKNIKRIHFLYFTPRGLEQRRKNLIEQILRKEKIDTLSALRARQEFLKKLDLKQLKKIKRYARG